MRALILAAMTFGMSAVSTAAMAQGFAQLDAMNRCEKFVEFALRDELGAEIKQNYKIVCYFGLIDPQIHEDYRAVCTRVSLVLPNQAARSVADFVCKGTYQTYLDEGSQSG